MYAYIWRGDLTKGFFALRFGRAYIWRCLYMEGLIFGILRYLQRYQQHSELGSNDIVLIQEQNHNATEI